MTPDDDGYTNEAYRKGEGDEASVVLVHFREHGEVFYHLQRWDELWVPYFRFRRADEAEFDPGILAAGFERFDVNLLPAAQMKEEAATTFQKP